MFHLGCQGRRRTEAQATNLNVTKFSRRHSYNKCETRGNWKSSYCMPSEQGHGQSDFEALVAFEEYALCGGVRGMRPSEAGIGSCVSWDSSLCNSSNGFCWELPAFPPLAIIIHYLCTCMLGRNSSRLLCRKACRLSRSRRYSTGKRGCYKHFQTSFSLLQL